MNSKLYKSWSIYKIQYYLVEYYDIIRVGNTKTGDKFKLKKYKQLVQKRKKYFGNKIESKSSNFSIKQNTIVLLLFIVVFIVCILKDLLNHMNKVQVY